MKRVGRLLILLGSLMLLTIAAFLLIVPRALEFWNRPLGPSLGFEELPTETNLPQALSVPNDPTIAPEEPTSPPVVSSLKPTMTPTSSVEPYCGGPEELIVMAVGIDYRKDGYLYGLADVIRIVRVDFVTPRVTVLSIPRDMWVEVPGISDHYGITHTKLNQTYFFGTAGMGYYDGPGLGAGLLARSLELNFGIQPDHYGVINMATFEDIVNVVGGIDIYLPVAVDGEVGNAEDNMGFFPQGWNHLNGAEAVKFSRIRKADDIFHRMDRQTQVLCAVREKVVSGAGVMNLPQMINAFSGRVLTDLSLAQMSQMACLLPKLDAGGIMFTSFPRELFASSSVYDPYSGHNTFVFDVDFNILKDYINKFLNGEWPLPSEGGEGGLSCEDFP